MKSQFEKKSEPVAACGIRERAAEKAEAIPPLFFFGLICSVQRLSRDRFGPYLKLQIGLSHSSPIFLTGRPVQFAPPFFILKRFFTFHRLDIFFLKRNTLANKY